MEGSFNLENIQLANLHIFFNFKLSLMLFIYNILYAIYKISTSKSAIDFNKKEIKIFWQRF